ncbi:MAG: hypothetical protein RIQ70_417 [Bacteroidota bacterium]
MKKILFVQSLLIISILVFVTSCNVAEKTESKSDIDSSRMEANSDEVNVVEGDLIVRDYEPKNLNKEAGFLQLTPKHRALLEPGDIDFSFNTLKFPFVDGHSVRLSIENGTKKFIFDANKKVTLPKGVFLCAAYLCDGNGVSVKNENSFQLTQLNIGIDEQKEIDLSQPMLFLNLPRPVEGSTILIDFMLFNVDLGKNADKVRVSIDNKTELYLKEWKSLKVAGLKPGKHTVFVELINNQGEIYDGIYANDVQEFVVQK